MRYKRQHMFIIALVTAVCFAWTGAFAYAATIETESFQIKDGEIEMEMPAETDVEESGETEHIMSAIIPVSGKNDLLLDLTYTYLDCGEEDVYLGTEEEAKEYYDEWGADALEAFLAEREAEEDITIDSLGEAAYQSEQSSAFISVIAKVQDNETGKQYCEKIYFTADTPLSDGDAVNRFLVFKDANKEYNAEQYKKADAYALIEKICLRNFHDYEYGQTFLEESGYAEYEEDDYEDSEFPWSVLIGFIIVVGGLLLRAGGGEKTTQSKPNKKKTTLSPKGAKDVHLYRPAPEKANTSSRTPKPTREKSHSDELRAMNRSRKQFQSKMQEKFESASNATHIKVSRTEAYSDAEEKYFESLRQMQKSGLVTKEEFEEIRRKHAERKSWHV